MTTATLAPQYDPLAIESDLYRRWLDAGVFTASVSSGREPYVIVIPPPNVTAVLHTGHGLNVTLQDVLIRFKRMQGQEALWLPGTDHAGIATQNVVERLLAEEGKTRHDIGRDAFVDRVWKHVKATGGIILRQLEVTGCSCDWSRTRFTLDDDYSQAVRTVFVKLHEDGLVYRGQRVIHWCPRCHTSLSDEEAEFRDQQDHLYYIRYRLVAGDDDVHQVVVATTRPETMFGDVCLVFHPEDEQFQSLRGSTVEIPLSGTQIPIYTSFAVERDFGTGMLKVTPAHDANDFAIAEELGGFERPMIMTEDAKMADLDRVPASLRGLDRQKARQVIIEQLRAVDQIERIEPYHHAVRHCYRCNTIVEPRLSDQWFVRMQPLAEPALEAYRAGRLEFVPPRWGTVYEQWLTQIRDWNISRQLWWGHRIPAWYCDDPACNHITVAMSEPASCGRCRGPVRQDEDVLDTWFSSWLWPFATLGWPRETADLERFYPGHTLVTGPDIIFFWVARMVMAGYHFLGDRPFETVVMNGIVRDTQHRKMSKSAGNGIDPIEVVERYGADAFRFTLVAGTPIGTDVILDPHDLETSFAPGRNFANKLWNIGRFIISNLDGAATPMSGVDRAQFELADRWILSRAQRAVIETTGALAKCRINDAANTLYQFLWGELADWYLEQVKPRLYGSAPGGDVARSILSFMLETALRLLHPIMPFITEELWSHLPGKREPLLAAAAWPEADHTLLDEEAEHRFGLVQQLVAAVRGVRAEYRVPPGTVISAQVQPATTDALESFNAEQRTIERLAKIDRLSMEGASTQGAGAHQVLTDGSAVFVPLGAAIDVDRECSRLTAEVDRIDAQLAAVRLKLANKQFVTRAPAEVVEREREKERSWHEQRETLAIKLRDLGC